MYTTVSPSTTSEPWKRNNLITPAGEHYGKLYFLSQEMETHLYLFDEVWQKIQPATREVKK